MMLSVSLDEGLDILIAKTGPGFCYFKAANFILRCGRREEEKKQEKQQVFQNK